jgi:16S rRNA (cytosine1402-N4)-methyltransferase
LSNPLNKNPAPALYHHASVLFQESVAILSPAEGSILVDCTMGGGGHTALMLSQVGPTGRVVAFDRDLIAIENARNRFAQELAEGRLTIIHAAFGQIAAEMIRLGLHGKIDGILADIGVSSHHLDVADRGFSFMNDGPLDMRMDQSQGQSAAEFLASADEKEIADVIFKFGEEPKSRFIAKLICERRDATPFLTTKSLATLIASKVFWKEASRKHPATRAFQGLRIHVNNELGELETLLANGPKTLRKNGVLAIISFHSLEDRMVKKSMQDWTGKTKRQQLPRDIPFTQAEVDLLSSSYAEIIKPFPIIPSDDEIRINPRARSAKLRAIRLTKECSIIE